MYEQYKSLERNQSDAAQQLKDKSYQDRILHQEMAERRARRRLCHEPGCQSESGIESINSNEKSCVSASNDDFFESFCEIHSEEEISRIVDHGLEELCRDDLRSGALLSVRTLVIYYQYRLISNHSRPRGGLRMSPNISLRQFVIDLAKKCKEYPRL